MIIICAPYPVLIVLNFIAIAIIAEFDNYVYASMRNEFCKKLITCKIAEKVLIVHHTSSKRCGDAELSDVKDSEGNFRLLKIKYGDRPCAQKCSYGLYKVCRIYFVSLYFYFLPFTAVMLSILVPLITETNFLQPQEVIQGQ